MSLSLDLARTLAIVAAEGTIEKAARTLHLTPSAVSQRIRTLEEQVGRVLLVRSKPVRPTEAGAAIVRLGRQLDLLERDALAQLAQGPDDEIDPRDVRPTTMPLAVNADSLGTWFLDALARAAQRHPLVFDLHREDQDFTAELLESGAVMAAVTSRARPVGGCIVRPLGAMRYEPFATPAFVARWFPDGQHPQAFAHAPIVDFDRRDDLQTQFLRAQAGDDLRPARHYVPSSADFATAIALGLGWGMLPPQQSAPLLAEGRIVRLDGEAIGTPLYWQQWNLRSPLLSAVADEVAQSARDALT